MTRVTLVVLLLTARSIDVCVSYGPPAQRLLSHDVGSLSGVPAASVVSARHTLLSEKLSGSHGVSEHRFRFVLSAY
jgi:hypothetical protein